MARTVAAMDGLALVGEARVGPLRLEVPGLLDVATSGLALGVPRLRSADGPSGVRRLVLSDGSQELPIDVPILAPEISGQRPEPVAAGPGVLFVHGPFEGGAPRPPRGTGPELVILGNARALWAEGRPFVDALRDVRARVGGAAVVWAPRVALPHRLPLLAYLGVDLVDATEALFAAGRGQFLDPTLGSLGADSVRAGRPCSCPACAQDPPGPLEAHARAALRAALVETRSAARMGRLRELVEARLVAEPTLAELLRYADRDLAGPLEERAPVTGGPVRSYALAESLRRPEMVRFRRRLVERYRPPPSKHVLVLVPCSKTKPYRNSRSHRRFLGALDGLAAVERLHIVSVSSPIGLVPRELEDVPPARQYDIPVTGDWSEPERAAVTEGLRHLLETGQYRAAICHLDPAEYGFLRPVLEDRLPVAWTLPDDHTTAPSALEALRAAAGAALIDETPVAGGPLTVVREGLAELASVQFGRAAAERLFAPPVRLAGRPWFQRLTDGRQDLATVREERGLFHLTLAGAARLGPEPPLAVDVDPALRLEGDLFAPGVRAADPTIRVGDSVVLRRDGLLAGVGEAMLPGPLLSELGRGLAVRVRHRLPPRTDTAMTEEPPRVGPGPVVQR